MSAQGYEQLQFFQEDFPANHFPWLESKRVKGTTVIYGRKCSELSPSLRRVGSSVRTYLESCELPLQTLYRTWSVRAITSSCLILKLRLSERRTEESGSLLFPTATTNARLCGGAGHARNLKRLVESGTITEEERSAMYSSGGQLNPTWVEWLMGFPIGWTDCDASGTQ